MRVLYDTNQLVQTAAGRGKSIAFRILVTADEISHVTSRFILDETETVLITRFGLTKRKARSAVSHIARYSEIVEPVRIEQVCRDPDDDWVLAAALAGRVDFLVTADKDLLVIKVHRNVRIIGPAEFTQILRRQVA